MHKLLTEQCPIEKPVKIGFSIIVVFLGGFLLWANLFPLESASIAEGVVIVANKNSTIQHEEGGLIKTLHVQDGQWVKVGDLLLTLDDTTISENLDSINKKLSALDSLRVRLIAERDGLQVLEYKDTPDSPELQMIRDNEIKTFIQRRQMLDENLLLMNKKIVDQQREMLSMQEHQQMLRQDVSLIQEERAIMKKLADEQFLEKTEILRLDRQIVNKLAEIKRLNTQSIQTEQRINDNKMRMNEIQKEYLRETMFKLRDTQEQLAVLEDQQKTLEHQLARTKLYAPVAGQVIELELHAAGAVIQRGQNIMTIVPSNAELSIEARINPLDIEMVNPGLKASINLSAFNTRYMNNIQAEVNSVSSDALLNQQTGEKYYIAKLSLTQELPQQLKPGMPVQVMIVNNEQTFLQYLLKPINKSLRHAFHEG